MVRVALFYVRDLPAAEDIAQEVFTRLWERQEDLSKIENVRGYLQYAVKNRSLNYLEHREVVDRYERDYCEHLKEEEGDAEEYLSLVRNLVNQLPPKRRQVLELNVVEEKSYQEIADQLGISLNTVKDHVKKAYAFLREQARKEIPSYILYFVLAGQKI